MVRSLLVAGMVMCVAQSTAGQALSPSPMFEVASIRRNTSGSPLSGGNPEIIALLPGGRFQAQNRTLEDLVRFAYGMNAFGSMLNEDQISGVSNWVREERFDIDAQAGGAVPQEQIYRMLQSLLEERFGAVVRRVQREGNIYVLARAHDDGPLGPELWRASADCVRPTEPAAILAASSKRRGTFRPSLSQMCASISDLIWHLQRILRSRVVDQTGLDGKWDYWVFASAMQPTISAAELEVDDRPPLPVALEQQLGLRLRQTRGQVEVFVIESIQRPTDN
jgi:uncharacterized protein (TIGR03435 family)